jgi:hypothetical protein
MITRLEKKLAKQKEQLERILQAEGKTSVRTDKYVLESKEVVTHRMNKASVPTEIWERYSKESSYSMLKISKMEGRIRKSL